jgi:ABC-type sugar transport system ATPase subunit
MMESLAVRVVDIRKAYPGAQALDQVSLDVHKGSIHALVGENGAGKSTLARVLAGDVIPDSGRIEVLGNKVAFRSPSDALKAGIATAYQEPSLLPLLSVRDNIFLGKELIRRSRWLDHKAMDSATAEVLSMVGADDVAPRSMAGALPIAAKQLVAIAKALTHQARILIMDEPSAVLAGAELERLLLTIRSLAEKGMAVVYISHRLAEVEAIANQVSIMRDGVLVHTGPVASITRREIIKKMVGRELAPERSTRKPASSRRSALDVRNLKTADGLDAGITFSVQEGEILGVAGLTGSGRSQMARAMVGLQRTVSGAVRVAGTELRVTGPRSAAKHGLVMSPEDRKELGLLLGRSVQENVGLPSLPMLSAAGFLQLGRERRLTRKMIESLRIRTSGPRQVVRELSGGNQQKVVLAKWLALEPKVLILDEPLQGIDVGAKEEIEHIVRNLTDQGAAIVFISSDLPDLIRVSDRIVVMSEGTIVGEVSAKDATETLLMSMAIGGST